LDADEQQAAHAAMAAWYASYTFATAILGHAPDEGNIIGAFEWVHDNSSAFSDATVILALLCKGMRTFWRDTGKIWELPHYLACDIVALRTLGECEPLAYMLRDYGTGLQAMDDLEGAEKTYREAPAMITRLTDTMRVARLREMVGRLAEERGDIDAAVAEMNGDESRWSCIPRSW
jgi:hypothetical protein